METRKTYDFLTDGILAYGICIGRFFFKKSHRVVYAISDFPHIAGSDVYMYYQISKEDYEKLLELSHPDRIPDLPMPPETAEAFRRGFLCGESRYCLRSKFTLEDVDMSLTEPY